MLPADKTAVHGVRKGTAWRTRRSTALLTTWPAGTPSRKTSPFNSPVTGG